MVVLAMKWVNSSVCSNIELMRGVVIKSTGSWYDVRQDDGSIVPCRLRGQFRIKGIKNTNPVVVGDFVTYELEEDASGWITAIEPRKNYIDRKSTNLSKISHLIASNIDRAFLIVTLKEPRTSLGFIDRFLVAAEGFRIPLCIVFNKIDFYTEAELAVVQQLQQLYESVGYQCLHTSVVDGTGLEALKQLMQGQTVLFSGHSGVGKSALLKAIAPELTDVRIGEISQYHSKGKHTTTFAKMYEIPSVQGFVIDTPGIKEFGLIQYSKEEIRDYFPEIRKYNNCCRFDDCTHVHEPGCAVLKAVEEGDIPSSRYMNYLAILQDDDLKIADWKLL